MYRALKLPAHDEYLAMISVVEDNVAIVIPYMTPVNPLEDLYYEMKRKVKMS